jgi:hypothetical protein
VLQFPENSTLIADTRNLEKFERDRSTSLTLEALCKYDEGQDLLLVRRSIDENDISFSDNAVGFLARHGDWSDKDRIIRLSKKYSGVALFPRFLMPNRTAVQSRWHCML